MLIKAKTTIIEGVTVTLNGNDSLSVGRDVTLISHNLSTIIGSGNNQSVTVEGTLRAREDGVQLFAQTPGGRATVVFKKTVVLNAGDDAAQVDNQPFTIVNHGLLSSEYGFFVNHGVGNSRITNTGTVLTVQQTVNANVAGSLTLVNSGRLISGSQAYFNVGDCRDNVLNSGLIRGDISLGSGRDLYDGRGGRAVGTIFGGSENDRFVPGASVDRIDGGDDVDTLDFRHAQGVQVALDESFVGTGTAKDDSYFGIENILGSTANDRLRGDAGDNRLIGNAGNDRLGGSGGDDDLSGGSGRDGLTGGTGEDFLSGGFGLDILSGGGGDDAFVFNAPGQGADLITDFSNILGNDDELFIASVTFGFPQAALVATTAEQFFHSGPTNQAQDRNDRFIFRTGDETLWFDADGKGGHGPILIADFADGVRLTADDFVLF